MNDFLADNLDCGLSVDLTPMIDVLFMLLIFFLTTSAFIKPALEVVLPEADSSRQLKDAQNRVVITIDRNGKIYLDQNPADFERIRSVLNTDGNRKINLFVDREAPFYSFIGVVDITRELGIEDVVVTTEKRKD